MEAGMLKISDIALEKLGELVAAEGGLESGVRIAPMGGGISSSGLGLAVDEPGEADYVVQQSGVMVIVDHSLMEYCKTITIEFQAGREGSCGGSSGSGFIITPGQPINF
jgi:Fe-S cluster assembly iron-binding protein IscA